MSILKGFYPDMISLENWWLKTPTCWPNSCWREEPHFHFSTNRILKNAYWYRYESLSTLWGEVYAKRRELLLFRKWCSAHELTLTRCLREIKTPYLPTKESSEHEFKPDSLPLSIVWFSWSNFIAVWDEEIEFCLSVRLCLSDMKNVDFVYWSLS